MTEQAGRTDAAREIPEGRWQYGLKTMFLTLTAATALFAATTGAFGAPIQRLSLLTIAVVTSYVTALILGIAPYLAAKWAGRML